MSVSDINPRPAKKRRFFVEDSPIKESSVQDGAKTVSSLNDDANALPATSTNTSPSDRLHDGEHPTSSQTDHSIHNGTDSATARASLELDRETLEAFVGDKVPSTAFERIKEASGNNMERAVNMYLDESWQDMLPAARPSSSSLMNSFTTGLPERNIAKSQPETNDSPREPKRSICLGTMPESRYVGAFGVGAWATRSGTSLIKMGEPIKIERTKIKPAVKVGRGGKAVQPARLSAAKSRVDVIVRFTNTRGEEVGRLPKETANWVSTLMDQKVCHFDGVCFLAPDRIRVNDTIELQLRCSLLRKAFEASGFKKPEDNNRTTGIFEEKETSDEKDLRLRQVALVKLFDEINLQPTTVNGTTAKHKRQGILQAAEIAEQYDKEIENKKVKPTQDGGSTPPDEEAEDGKELEQDQLDSLYKKAQSFDFDTPTQEPGDTFTMDLRKYQMQALHWMMSKEKDEASGKEVSMHPLWEEYTWPIKDMDDQEVARVSNQSQFFVNPYSGELSLEFPVQEQHCLGGILADGK